MFIQYQKGDAIRLRNVEQFDDPMDWGMDAEAYARVLEAQRTGELFVITCEACDGYFDLKSPSNELFAISQHHFEPATWAPDRSSLTFVDL